MSTALITGPTAGIGKSIAYQLAEKGYDLFLVARREDRLQDLKSDIENKFQVRVHYLKSDLASPDAPQEIYDYGKSMNLDISTLILNAGYQINTKLEEATLQEEEDCLRVLGLSVIMQSKLYIKDLMSRGGGHIMVVSSMAGFSPPSTEFAILYGPVKTFMNRFVEALNGAYNKNNIYSTALCPGFTVTEFHTMSGTQDRMDKVPSFMKLSADQVAQEGIDGMFKNKEIVIPGNLNRFLISVLRFFPTGAIKWIGNKIAGGRYK
ncbi:MAG: short-chain dehydrogenase [Gammaproteobacteria bacterium]|jgi:short-subunit dehydrogenase|nr:MAG: short-chain dehydrogenase [Gammaproteobacteria bacterium]|tara:strand:- start:94 stop:885 length:792 start_codon:yes stop_codon:yes gene_type:complete